MKLRLGTIEQRVDFDIDKALEDVATTGELEIADIAFVSADIPSELTGITVTLTHDIQANVPAAEIRINAVRASLQQVAVALEGSVEDFDATPVIDLRITSEPISMSEILAEIPVAMVPEMAKTKGEGTLNFLVTARGALDSAGPSVEGNLTLENGMIHYTDLPKSIRDLAIALSFTTNSLDISKFSLKLGDNPVDLVAAVHDFESPTVDARLDASVNLGDLKSVMTLPEGNSLDGSIEAHVKAKGEVDPEDPTTMDVDGTVKLQEVKVVTPALLKPLLVDGSLGLSPAWVSQQLSIDIGSSHMDFQAQLTDYLSLVVGDSTHPGPRPRLTFSLNSPLLNTNEFLPENEAPPEQAEAADEPADPDALLMAAPLPGIDMEGSIVTKKLMYKTIELSDISASMKTIDDVMDVSLRAKMFDGGFRHELDLNARDINNLKIASDLKISRVEIADLLSGVEAFIPEDIPLAAQIKELDKSLSGRITFENSSTTRGGTSAEVSRNLEGTIFARLADGKITGGSILDAVSRTVGKFYELKDIEFDDMKIRARIENEKVYFDEFDIDSRLAGNWGVGGGVGFDATLDLTLSNQLPESISSKILGVQQKGKSAVKNLLGGVPGGDIASGLVDQGGIPVDNDGRVVLLIGLKGPAARPGPTFEGFGGDKRPGEAGESPKEVVTKKIKEEVEKAKEKARQEVRKQKEKVEQEVKQRKEAVEKKVEKEVEQKKEEVTEKKEEAVDKLKEKTGKKLKGLF